MDDSVALLSLVTIVIAGIVTGVTLTYGELSIVEAIAQSIAGAPPCAG